jgi:hypothetical protein
VSEDGQYVLKFLKHQRFRTPSWFSPLRFLPAFDRYVEEKREKKWYQLNRLCHSWKLCFDHLKEETALLMIHLNTTQSLKQRVVLYDKVGWQHDISLDEVQFCLQRYGEKLETTLLRYRDREDVERGAKLLQKLFLLLHREFMQGFADDDHALLQNSGVVDESPVHIDIGQFVLHPEIQKEEVWKQLLFTKVYKLEKWCTRYWPALIPHLRQAAIGLIGASEFSKMRPQFHLHGEEGVSNQVLELGENPL